MQKQAFIFILSFILLVLSACLSQRDLAKFKKGEQQKNTITLNELKVTPNRTDDFRIVPSNVWNILHTDLQVSFNWGKHECIGKESLWVKPYFYSSDSILLNAKSMVFDGITILDDQNEPILHTVDYNRKVLKLKLERKINSSDSIQIVLSYTARPDEVQEKGSKAIKDGQGLYFINTDHDEPYKPVQIWTQGETEASSCWFPTIDQPNEKFTMKLAIQVNKGLTTLSNGRLISSTNVGNSKVDTWESTKPLPAYLVMMAVGNFNITYDELKQEYKDSILTFQWDTIRIKRNDTLTQDSIVKKTMVHQIRRQKDILNGLEVSYYLEDNYAPFAKQIFKHTPAMIDFFGGKLGVEYPWEKYAQVVVRDYISGAMENTSATLHGEFVQKNSRELIDKNNDDIIAHELFHQWFGDLVTCKSWSHLVLNEGFAVLGEQLWREYKYGSDAGLLKGYISLERYLASTQNNGDDPIIQFNYKDKEDMFNTITYQKGSRVLNLLRSMIGDEAFFLALKNYLSHFAFSNADIDDFRKECESVTGVDLRNFFQQWFYKGGHPIIELHYSYNDSTQLMSVQVEQVQDKALGLFKFPLTFKVTQGGQPRYVTFQMAKRLETFFVKKMDEEQKGYPNVFVDPFATFVGEIKDNKPFVNYIHSYHHATTIIEKIRSLQELQKLQASIDTARSVLLTAINDAHEEVRSRALDWIDWSNPQNLQIAKEVLLTMAQSDPNSSVRAKSIAILSNVKDGTLFNTFVELSKDSSYSVAASALEAVYKLMPVEALRLCAHLAMDAKGDLFDRISTIYSNNGDYSHATFFEQHMMKVFGRNRSNLIDDYADYCIRMNTDSIYHSAIQLLSERAYKDKNKFVRFNSIMALHSFYEKQMTDVKLIKDIGQRTQKEVAINLDKENVQRLIDQEQDEDVLNLLRLKGLGHSHEVNEIK